MDFIKSKIRYSAYKGDDINNYLLIGIVVVVLITLGILVFNMLKKKERYAFGPHKTYKPTSCADALAKQRGLMLSDMFYDGQQDDINSVNSYIFQNNCK